MKIGFFSDVHANLEALTAVLENARSEKVDKLFFLGDAVGYGPNPNECVELICANASACLMGNHDYAALGMLDTSSFNRYAKEAIDFTQAVLTKQNRNCLMEFEREYLFEDFHMVHSTPTKPNQWDYIITLDDAEQNFPTLKRRIGLIGHSHFPAIVCKANGSFPVLVRSDSIKIEKDQQFIINIGSVGQPRDNNPDSCYMLYDSPSNMARLKRVKYDIKITQDKMSKAGLSEYLINRLEKGR